MAKSLEDRVTELEKEVKKLKGAPASIKKIKKEFGIRDTFELLGLKWTILDITEQGYKCLAERLPNDKCFDETCNDWQSSDLRSYLNTVFYEELIEEVGEDNVVPFERDLLSLDGQTEYGICEDKVSLLNVDEYRKYRKLIPNTEDYWWWTLTADSTTCNDDSRWVAVVSPRGYIFNRYSCRGNCGVRPFCIFSSSIFESEE